jgi:hypothetical protein
MSVSHRVKVKQVYVLRVNFFLTTSEAEARIRVECEYLTTTEVETSVRVENECLSHIE